MISSYFLTGDGNYPIMFSPCILVFVVLHSIKEQVMQVPERKGCIGPEKLLELAIGLDWVLEGYSGKIIFIFHLILNGLVEDSKNLCLV